MLQVTAQLSFVLLVASWLGRLMSAELITVGISSITAELALATNIRYTVG